MYNRYSVKTLTKNQILLIAVGLIVGILLMVTFRFIVTTPQDVHYHSNFAVYVEGERLPFDNFTYYEEIAACSSDELNNPKSRVHMHNQESYLVHVHDAGVTWGHFFANLGMTAGDTLFKTDKDTFVEGFDKVNIRYILNDKEVDTIANRTIESADTLLVSIGSTSDEDLQNEYSQIPQDAAEHNEESDPLTCSGGSTYSFMDRLKIAVGINH
jgi:hypothetical protein